MHAIDMNHDQLREAHYQVYAVLEKYGLIVHQVDTDDEGRAVFNWLIKADDMGVIEGIGKWHEPWNALDAALYKLLID